MKTVYVNIFSVFWSSLLIFPIFAVIESTEQVDNTTLAEGYGTDGSPTENTNATQYEGVGDIGLKTNQTEEIPIGIPVEKEEFDRMKEKAKD